MPATIYQIRVKGQLGPQWAEWFDGMTITPEENGDTTISGPVADQPALHALLVRIRDLGMTLLALNQDDLSQPADERVICFRE